jgi:hypothetical protein
MASYTHEYSQFPIETLKKHYFKDVDDSVAPLINQIKELQNQGQYDKVNEIVKNNIENLSKYVLSTEYINLIDEETRNLEIYTKSKKQSIFYDDEEPEGNTAVFDVWIGGELT